MGEITSSRKRVPTRRQLREWQRTRTQNFDGRCRYHFEAPSSGTALNNRKTVRMGPGCGMNHNRPFLKAGSCNCMLLMHHVIANSFSCAPIWHLALDTSPPWTNPGRPLHHQQIPLNAEGIPRGCTRAWPSLVAGLEGHLVDSDAASSPCHGRLRGRFSLVGLRDAEAINRWEELRPWNSQPALADVCHPFVAGTVLQLSETHSQVILIRQHPTRMTPDTSRAQYTLYETARAFCSQQCRSTYIPSRSSVARISHPQSARATGPFCSSPSYPLSGVAIRISQADILLSFPLHSDHDDRECRRGMEVRRDGGARRDGEGRVVYEGCCQRARQDMSGERKKACCDDAYRRVYMAVEENIRSAMETGAEGRRCRWTWLGSRRSGAHDEHVLDLFVRFAGLGTDADKRERVYCRVVAEWNASSRSNFPFELRSRWGINQHDFIATHWGEPHETPHEILSNASSEELCERGNRDHIRLLRAQNHYLDEYNELFKAYVRLAAYCKDLMAHHTTIQSRLEDLAFSPLPQFDPDTAAVELAADFMGAGVGAAAMGTAGGAGACGRG
ncbi:hypothetical protein FB45DRAFT_1006349 [Roridomyces roridus]|uniref:Uncharacterized protein n=1 Tax=Roridomyces roridus TaxID=1738132 RepID=A0AAD7BJC0_9AGAR|nr:hypothetical protein FB45DRAFT_1006349 [Roridomyces roridus]